MKKNYLEFPIIASAILALGCTQGEDARLGQRRQSATSCVPTSATLGFENIAYWSASTPTLSVSTIHEQGTQAIAYNGGGYVRIVSSPLCSIGAVGTQLKYRLYVPNNQPNPWWWGQTQLLIHAPSLGIHDQFIAGVELTNNVVLGQFNTIAFTLPSDVRNKLKASGYADLQLKLVLNVPSNAAGPYVLDNVTSGKYEDPDGDTPPPGLPTEEAAAGFEEPLSWQGQGATLSLDSDNAAFGGAALAVNVTEAGAWTSAPLTTVAGITPDSNRIGFLAKLPAATTAQLAVYLEAASIGLGRTKVVDVSLAEYSANEYHAFSVELSDAMVATLNGASYTDLKVRFEIVGAAAGTYYFDDLQLGRLGLRLYDHDAETDDFEESESDPIVNSSGSVSSTFRRSPSTKFPGKPKGPS